MRRSSLVCVLAALAVTASQTTPAVAASPGPAHHGAPASVSHIHAYDERPAIRLTWSNPTGGRFDHVVVRYARGSQAPKHRHGHYDGHRAHVGRHATSATLRHLASDTVYSATVWAVGSHGARSAPRHVHVTTDGGTTQQGRYTARFTDTSGHPLAGVVVTAESFLSSVDRSATSGRDGRVSLRLPVGEYELVIGASRATGGTSDATGYVGTDRFTTVHAHRTQSAGTTALRAAGSVRVHVVDATGRPVAGALPTLSPLSPFVQRSARGDYEVPYAYIAGPEPLGSARTDVDGDATVTGVPTGTAFQVCLNPYAAFDGGTTSRFLSTCTSSTALARPGATVAAATLTVQRRAGATVTGVVRTGDGRGHGTSYVYVERGHEAVATVRTQRNGRFRAAGLAPGRYRVCASDGTLSVAGRTGYQPACAAHPIAVSGTSTVSATIVRRVAAAATGTITGPHGVPVAGDFVEVGRYGTGGYAETDSLGHYLLKGITGGRRSLCIMDFGDSADTSLPFGVRDDCGRHRIRFGAETGRVRTGLDARLRVGAALSGTVVDRRGRPVPFAEVDVFHDGSGIVLLAGARGRFAVSGLNPTRYKVCAKRIPGSPSDRQDELEDFNFGVPRACANPEVVLHAGRRRHGVRLVLPTTATVRVTAVDEQGHAVAGVDAAVVAACHQCDGGTSLLPKPDTAVLASGLTGGAGSVVLDGLPPGKYAVCLFAYYGTTRSGSPPTGYADRCVGTTFTVVVRAGHATSRRVVLHPAGAVSGRITDAAGHPLQGALVRVGGSAADDLPQDDVEFETSFAAADGNTSAPPAAFSRTAADGTYTIRSVRPGQRQVCVSAKGVSDPSGTGYLSQCVGGAVGSTKKGTPVAVHGAATTGGVDLALTAGGSVTGHITSPVGNKDNAVVLFRGQDYVTQKHPDSSYDYEFTDLAPGTYEVCVDAFDRNTQTGRCHADAAWDPETATGPAADATPIQVTAGAESSGIDITVPN
ncbi:hypothetical protein [Jatrophihabitans endophyticus]|uniref:hypothetical protein n=1 Tax=Jatrophihabitans endophyticus TaxID=1206085 RepID=UPI0019E54558|nr:hypothetical protein [Jatrophihabitans endophyticus]MBE7186912.1 hypothetical protein [Jatrophihabitans endophyticus]